MFYFFAFHFFWFRILSCLRGRVQGQCYLAYGLKCITFFFVFALVAACLLAGFAEMKLGEWVGREKGMYDNSSFSFRF